MPRELVPQILHVEDNTLLQRTLSRYASSLGLQTRAVWTVEEALDACHQSHLWCGFVVDQMLPARRRCDTPAPHGLALLEQFASQYPRVPRLLMTGVFEPSLTTRCANLDAIFLHKSFEKCGDAPLLPFLKRAAALARELRWPDLASLTREIRASRREEELLRAYLSRPRSKRELAMELGIESNTVKAHIRAILSKAQASSMQEIAAAVLTSPAAEEASVRATL